MPSVLNAHTTSSDGNTQFGLLKVDWTTRSFDTEGLSGNKLPPLQPPPSAAVPGVPTRRAPPPHPAMKDGTAPGLVLPRIKAGSGDYLMKVVSNYLKKEISEEMDMIR